MTYAQGGLIQATDYNNLVGTSSGSTTTALNTVWSVGSGSAGWGQTAISQAAATAGLVTATQWATLINTINSANLHINNTSSGLTANTTGQIIGYSGSLQTTINGIYSDRLKFASNSAAVAGSALAYAAWTSTTTSSTLIRSFGANVTFASANQARYFFNAGGRLKFNITATTTGGAGTRGAATKALVDYIGGVALFGANTNGNVTGTGGTWGGGTGTAFGYHALTTANTNIAIKTSTTANYTTDKIWIHARSNGTQGANNDSGSIVSFWTTVASSSGGNSGGSFDDTLNLTPTVSVDISYPEVTNISNTWGAVTVTQV